MMGSTTGPVERVESRTSILPLMVLIPPLTGDHKHYTTQTFSQGHVGRFAAFITIGSGVCDL